MAYLYYLPFAAAFASGDGLHRRTVPLFLSDNQSFIDAAALKTALQELDAHYDALPEEIKQLGVLAFASYPPPTLHNAVTRLWDDHMRPDWRDIAAELHATLAAPRDEEAERRTVDELNARIDEAELVDDQAATEPGGAARYCAGTRCPRPRVSGGWYPPRSRPPATTTQPDAAPLGRRASWNKRSRLRPGIIERPRRHRRMRGPAMPGVGVLCPPQRVEQAVALGARPRAHWAPGAAPARRYVAPCSARSGLAGAALAQSRTQYTGRAPRSYSPVRSGLRYRRMRCCDSRYLCATRT